MLENFTSRLKKAVKEAGGNKAISKKSGIVLGTLSQYIRGISEPSISKIAAIAEAWGVSLDWLAYGKDVNDTNPIDRETLTDAIEVLENALNKRNGTLPPKAKAEALMLAYEILIEDDNATDIIKASDFKSFLKLVS